MKFSRLFVYYLARKIKDRVGQVGAELRDTLDVMKTYGVATDTTWPFHFHRVNVEPSLAAYRDAEIYCPMEYKWAEIDLFKKYLHDGLPIISGIHTGRMFWKINGPLPSQTYKTINMDDNRNYRGHAVTIIGYDDNLCGGSWIIANTLGLKWGDRGIGILPYECYVDIGESYVITEFAGITRGKKISEN